MVDDTIKNKLIAATKFSSATDIIGQMADMVCVMLDELNNNMLAVSGVETGQVYARPYQVAERWGYTEGGLRRFLYAAEQSGKVRTMTPKDINGAAGQKLYHLRDLERFFACNK